MNEPMNIRELISRYVDGQVNLEERRLVEDQLKQSTDLNAYYQELKKLNKVLDEWTTETVSGDWETKMNNLLGTTSQEDHPMKKTTYFWLHRKLSDFLSPLVFSENKVGGAAKIADKLSSNAIFLQTGVLVTLCIMLFVTVQVYVKRGLQGRLKSATDDIGDQFSVGNASQYQPYYLTTDYSIEREMAEESWRYNANMNTEEYGHLNENQFLTAKDNPLSTFSIDVDTASYSNIRRFLEGNQMPPVDSVRIEEMINYFSYDYPQPKGADPFSMTTKGAVCPWNSAHQLVLVGLQGKVLDPGHLAPSNLVFLIDVSGSMADANKLPLLKSALKMMVNQLTEKEHVAIVVYAGAAGEVLGSTPGNNKAKILEAIDRLQSGGSTAGGAGINLAYAIAKENFIKEGNNRVILATDGDFNVGVSSDGALVRLIEDKRKEGVFLTVLGFGTGNYKDSKMEQLADKGNGNYYYIDTLKEAKKVLVEELGSTLFTIAKDVKIQIEFNPSQVKAYRLVGYENRILAKEDFNDDKKDAGELGAGHTVTALYEIVPVDSKEEIRKADELSYQQSQVVDSPDLMTLKLRYKDPDGEESKLITQKISPAEILKVPEGDFAFAAAVAEFGLLLRNSEFKGDASYDQVIQSASVSKGEDRFGYREEFLGLVKKVKELDHRSDESPSSPAAEGINFKAQ